MEQDLSRRLVWLLGDGAQGARLELALTEAGSACVCFESVEALTDAMHHSEPELMLVGAEIFEETDELELCIEALRRPPASSVPIVMVTGDGSVEMRRRMFKAGVDDFVLEPVVGLELLNRVHAQLMLHSDPIRGEAGPRGPSEHRSQADGPGASFVVNARADAPMSILVADAEPMIQRVLRSSFERRGWFVSTASDGREALELSTQAEFDLVVFDLNLPFKNGFELLDELGGAAATRRPRMIVLSAEKQHDSVLRAFELGADDFVSKPVDPDILVARIERLVRPVGSTKDAH